MATRSTSEKSPMSWAAKANAATSSRKPEPKKPKDVKRPANKSQRSVPKAVAEQLRLCTTSKYSYRVIKNSGNVENNSTLYITTGPAHPSQVNEIFDKAVQKAALMPELFGENYKCSIILNFVHTRKGSYIGYAFVDISDPKLYYALIGCNVDGTERVEYIDDPHWVPPKRDESKSKLSWADDAPSPPQLRKELPALITLDKYEYDEHQKNHLQTAHTHGCVSISPAFVTPGINEDYDECSLFVSPVPDDYEFLYATFSRYARTQPSDSHFYPKIFIRQGKELHATIRYADQYDAKFALLMLRKIRAKYNDTELVMHVRNTFKRTDKKHEHSSSLDSNNLDPIDPNVDDNVRNSDDLESDDGTSASDHGAND